jgi:hypothetical protein
VEGKRRVELLNGGEYQTDLEEIDQAFKEIRSNDNYLEELLMGEDT